MRRARVQRGWTLAGRAALVALAGAQVAHGLRPAPRPPTETRRLLAALLAVATGEAVAARGARRGAPVVATAAAIGFAAELGGVATGLPFGRYEYTERLGPRVGGVPLLAAAAWASLARPAWVAAGWLTRRPAARVPIAAAGLTAWDVFVDPRMAAEGYWSWPGGGRYEGVPASNFAGWFATGCAVFAAIALLDREPPDERDDGALALYAWTWAGETFANATLWRRPVTAAAGAAAMGALAVPALVRRARA